jgi:hypothetical protein
MAKKDKDDLLFVDPAPPAEVNNAFIREADNVRFRTESLALEMRELEDFSAEELVAGTRMLHRLSQLSSGLHERIKSYVKLPSVRERLGKKGGLKGDYIIIETEEFGSLELRPRVGKTPFLEDVAREILTEKGLLAEVEEERTLVKDGEALHQLARRVQTALSTGGALKNKTALLEDVQGTLAAAVTTTKVLSEARLIALRKAGRLSDDDLKRMFGEPEIEYAVYEGK